MTAQHADIAGGEELRLGEHLLEMRFDARPDILKTIRDRVREAAGKCGFGSNDAHDLVIAVDEACQNIIRHAYKGRGGDAVLEILRDDDSIIVLLHDFADPVDLGKIKPRSLDDVRPGGLGTHFIRAVMDEVDYLEPPAGVRGNLLRLAKHLPEDKKDKDGKRE
ncbi:MAG: ATP-binding protein [Rhodospirillales bacterium]|nr:ATP-binding protein [Rhodospirillales bacterium]MCW8862421.1 ATP-binding protein [Rhodospirillales bacterium]MCW8953114.1 ATP-binding protein [Rhodospirillales bacterium]MCW8969834.1 ATP-binding protein [Rhodospirillales bacterium]MCW9001579.1 ATP-binding protein [Rhodospirillales bacterium]